MLAIRKLANREGQERVVRFDPVTGEKKLVNPATSGEDHEPWPMAGVRFEGEAPDTISVPMSYIDIAVAEGWVTRINERGVVRPAGPSQEVWASSHTGIPHTFIQADEVVFHMIDGDYRYKVVRQPDKYAVGKVTAVSEPDKALFRVEPAVNKKVTPAIYASGETMVCWDYELERISG